MKRLLVLLVLSPVILFGQSRRGDLIDSIKAATMTGLQNAAASSGNGPRIRVENVQVLDSGEYVTISVRVHMIEASAMAAVPAHPLIAAKIADVTAARLRTEPVPPTPHPPGEPDAMTAITPLPVLALSTAETPAGILEPVPVPPIPHPVTEPEVMTALPIVSAAGLRTQETTITFAAAAVPKLPPPVEEEVVSALPLAAVAKLNPGAATPLKLDIAEVPPLPEVPPIIRPPVAVLPLIRLPTRRPLILKDTIVLATFFEKKMPVQEMHLSPDGYSLLEKLEGFAPELYSLKDGGFTIGFGFFVPYGEGSKWDKGVSWADAERIIRQKMPQYEDQVKQYINVPLTQNEFDALTMLAYNLGGFSKATSIVNDINGQVDYHKLQSDWTRFVHSKAPNVTRGLMNRRKDELGVKKESDYQPQRKIQIFKVK